MSDGRRIEIHHGREYIVEGPRESEGRATATAPAVADESAAAPPDDNARNATWWRDKFARAERTLAEIADAIGAPRASDYGDLPAAVKDVVAALHQDLRRAEGRTSVLEYSRDAVRCVLEVTDGEGTEQATRRVVRERDAALADAAALRAGAIALQDTLRETQATLDAIWDAVGGVCEGEALVDAVRRAAGNGVHERPRLAATQRWRDASGREIVTYKRYEPDESGDLVVLLPFDQRMIARTGDAAPSGWTLVSGGPARPADAWNEEAKMGDGMGHANECATTGPLDGVLREASEQVAKWPEWQRSDDVKRRRAEFDARMRAMGVNMRDSAACPRHGVPWPAHDCDACLGEATGGEPQPIDGQRPTDGWSEERLRTALDGANAAIMRIAEEGQRAVDAAYRRGQEDMRERAATHLKQASQMMQAIGKPDEARELLAAHYAIRSIPIENAPAAFVSEVPGEAWPGGPEAAGAGNSVARESDTAAEIARLRTALSEATRDRDTEQAAHQDAMNQIANWKAATECATPAMASEATRQAKAAAHELAAAGYSIDTCGSLADAARRAMAFLGNQRSLVAPYAADIRAWRAATGVDSPDAARIRIAQIEADLARVREGRSGGAVAQVDGAAGERMPRMGDSIVYKAIDGEHPAVVLGYEPARGPCGTIHVRDLRTLELVTISADTSSLSWRFRD